MVDSGSFIPRQGVGAKPKQRTRRKLYVLTYFVYVLLFGTILTIAALFVWQLQLERGLAEQKALLDQQRSTFSQSDIAQVRELDAQLEVLRSILDAQPAFSKLFTALEETTLQNITLSGFALSSKTVDQYEIILSGDAPNFDAILFQRDVLDADPILSAAEIIGVSYEVDSEDIFLQNSIGYQVSVSLPVSAVPYTGDATTSFIPTEDVYSDETQVFETEDKAELFDETGTETVSDSDEALGEASEDNDLTI